MFDLAATSILSKVSLISPMLATDINDVLNKMKTADTSKLDPIMEQTEMVGAGVYKIVFTVMVICFVVGLMLFSIRFFGADPHTKSAMKGDFFWKAGAIVMGFASVAIVILLFKFGDQLFL